VSWDPYKTCIGAHRHIGAYRGAWWLATLSHMAANDGGNMHVTVCQTYSLLTVYILIGIV